MIELSRDVVPRLAQFFPKVYYKHLNKQDIIAPSIIGTMITPYAVIPVVVKFKNMEKYVLLVESLASALSFRDIPAGTTIQCKIYELLIDVEDYVDKIAQYAGEEYEPTITKIEATGTYPEIDVSAVKSTLLAESKVKASAKWHLLEAALKSTISPIESMIQSYMDVPRSIPLLTGHTGVAKSSLVNAVVGRLNKEKSNQYGFREHTIKVGYLDRLDILGYVTTRDIEGLGTVSEFAPMYELMISEDRFVESARKALDQFDAPPKDPKELIAYEKLAYFAKTPVLFFDEVNRTPKGIFNLITTLFDQRRIQEYTFNTAKMIAAANIVSDPMTGEVKDTDLYKVATLSNPAIIERLKPITVTADDVEASFRRMYREKKWTIGPVLDKYSMDDLHHVSEDMLERPNTTLRTWEYLEKYVNWIKESDEKPYIDVLEGIGLVPTMTNHSKIIGDIFAGKPVYSADSPEIDDPMQTFIDHCYGAGLPTMLVGRFGIAKTARIEQTAKKQDAEVLHISLSATDRTLINGTPTPVNIMDAAFSKSMKDTEAFNKLQGVLSTQSDIPLRTTKSMPNAETVTKLKEAVRTNKKLLIVFDEFNMGSAVVQSAVFGAISDYKLFGVTLDPVNTRFMCTGNVSTDEIQYSGAEQLDAATVARFSMFRKDTVDEKDVELFKKYAKSHFTPSIYSAIEAVSIEALKKLVSEMPDDPQLGTSISCSRSFEVASNIIEHDPLFRGAVPTVDTTKWSSPDAINRMCFSLPGQTIEFKNGVEYPIEMIPKLWEEQPELRDEIIEIIPDIGMMISSYRNSALATTFSKSLDGSFFVDLVLKRLDEIVPGSFVEIYDESVSVMIGATHTEILASTLKRALESKVIDSCEDFLTDLKVIMSKYFASYGGWSRTSLSLTLQSLNNTDSTVLRNLPAKDGNEVRNILSDIVTLGG